MSVQIQYAKKNIDGVTSGVGERVTTAKDKLAYIWEEINKTEDQVATDETNEEGKPQPTVREPQKIQKMGGETAAFASAAYLMKSFPHLLPSLEVTKLCTLKAFLWYSAFLEERLDRRLTKIAFGNVFWQLFWPIRFDCWYSTQKEMSKTTEEGFCAVTLTLLARVCPDVI